MSGVSVGAVGDLALLPEFAPYTKKIATMEECPELVDFDVVVDHDSRTIYIDRNADPEMLPDRLAEAHAKVFARRRLTLRQYLAADLPHTVSESSMRLSAPAPVVAGRLSPARRPAS